VTPRGQLALVLHAHLPYVRHPEHDQFIEEHWLFQAILESYLPLTLVLRRAAQRSSSFRLTLSVSPTLLSQLVDPLLQRRFLSYLGEVMDLCRGEVERQGASGKGRLASWYLRRLRSLRRHYLDELGGDLIAAWTGLRQSGLIELMTTAATHGYLPLLRTQGLAVRAQLRVGRDAFTRLTGVAPDGLWLPECGYYPGLEREISETGYRYTILETHGIQQARPKPRWDVYGPLSLGGISLFGRDPFSAAEVWSRDRGFPGNPLYREYHRDLGFAAEEGVLDGFLPPGVAAAPTGIKYYRVTGAALPKALYDPGAGAAQAARDARRFLDGRRRLAAQFPAHGRPPLVVAPYDAELFGHWWFEGPLFLGALIRELDRVRDLEAVTLGDHLGRYGPAGECLATTASSWGEEGYNTAWLRPETGWIHLGLHQAAAELRELLRTRGPGRGTVTQLRMLRQAARSLLLAQGSDWSFHVGRSGAAEYAGSRVRGQLARFAFLANAVRRGEDPGDRVAVLERMDNLFPELQLAHFADGSEK
jgi:1,4-alpha-glucan branching enzyme